MLWPMMETLPSTHVVASCVSSDVASRIAVEETRSLIDDDWSAEVPS